jgi:hypothetical protein
MKRLLLGLLASLLAAGALANPLQLIGHGSPEAFVEPEGYYRVILPGGFACAPQKNKREVRCSGARGSQALVVLQVLDVPKSATVDLVALNEMQRLKKKPHFKHLGSANETIDGSPARLEKFRYDYLGNVEYPVAVQALYLVRENKLFIVHFEAPLMSFSTYAKDLVELYGTFKPAQLDEGGHPVLESMVPAKKGLPRTDEELIDRENKRIERRQGVESGY